jgi:murein DD-endopeptidase MepM/ murein hydrolase activator NlpD
MKKLILLLLLSSMCFGYIDNPKSPTCNIRPYDFALLGPCRVGRFNEQRQRRDGTYRPHNGVDYRMVSGTFVNSTAAGVVWKLADENDGYGLKIIIDHGNGIQTIYAHLVTPHVLTSMKVFKGQVIAESGGSGGVKPHLHYGVRKWIGGKWGHWEWVDPYTYGLNEPYIVKT